MTKINGLEFSFGADPEVFISKGGKPVSAFGMVKGTKQQPFAVKGGAVQVDGMALEFNIDPANDAENFQKHLDNVLKQMLKMVPGYNIHTSCVADFGEEYIKNQPKEASELGCNPDYNAYTGKPNPRPDGAAGFRTAAGHLHIGWTNGVDPMDPGHFNACRRLVKQLDRYVGTWSILMDQGEAAQRRRQLYGKAGAFRPTHFGVEYRVLSNFWLLDEENAHWKKFVVGNSVKAIEDLFNDPDAADRDVGYMKAEKLINEGDVQQVYRALQSEGVEKIPSPAAYR